VTAPSDGEIRLETRKGLRADVAVYSLLRGERSTRS
jgi:hypothetical protein